MTDLDTARLLAEARERLREATTPLAVGQAPSQRGPSVEGMRRVDERLAVVASFRRGVTSE